MQQPSPRGCPEFAAPAPDPRTLAARVRPRRTGADAERETRTLECISCGAHTDHVRGPVTFGPDGSVLVQWWTCQECPDGRTVG